MRLANHVQDVWSRLGALVLATALFTLAVTAGAGAATIVNSGNLPPELPKPDTSQIIGAPVHASPAATEAYWTPERMAAAKPVDESIPTSALSAFDPQDFGAHTTSWSAKGDFTPENTDAYPLRVHGKVFFRSGDTDYTCSGTVVDSAKKNVIFTAGRCVYNPGHDFVTKFIFVPGYKNGPGQYGTYNAAYLQVPQAWSTGGSRSYDIGAVSLDKPIQADVGARKIAFVSEPTDGQYVGDLEYTIYGYPWKPSEIFDGEVLQGCRVTIGGYDTSSVNVPPYPLYASPCAMRQGSTGGGWITNGGYLNSVMTPGYCDSEPNTCGTVIGPYFSKAALGLYAETGGSAKPTVKVVKAPRRVVRKRRVVFRFGGTAATPINYLCKLDGQREIACSSRIIIRNLRPGWHTLRVRSYDQTGNLSRKKITKSFWVIPRRR